MKAEYYWLTHQLNYLLIESGNVTDVVWVRDRPWRCHLTMPLLDDLTANHMLRYTVKYVIYWPATCRGCTAADELFCTCTVSGNSPHHRTVHMFWDSPQPAPSSQCATPDIGRKAEWHKKKIYIYICIHWWCKKHFICSTLMSPDASSTMRCCAASSGRAWSSITLNFPWSTFAVWTTKVQSYVNEIPDIFLYLIYFIGSSNNHFTLNQD